MKNNEIFGAKIIDTALQINDYLIISDIHLGYEQSLNAEGIMVPRFQYKKIIKRLKEIKNVSNATKIIINGDLKHEFGKISKQEWNEVIDFTSFLKKNFDEILLIKGNHDNFTKFIAKKSQLEVYEKYSVENYLIIHGDKIPKGYNKIKEETIIIGHEHPSISIRNVERVEKIKCFLKGKLNGKNLIVMPSFNFITEGSDVMHEKTISPFLDADSLEDFEVIAVEYFEILYFGKIKDLIKIKDKFI
ncbi:MAG: metallophosphoesterase [Methanobacterium sp.]|uniref:metallophosphoesterase n=1 Tax=Methanobacterium sp. TaxID=2164 RepID=UPI003D653A84|nr:metallophosphoesterase [Methanobacterium sp.]